MQFQHRRRGEAKRTYRFLTKFHGKADMPAEFRKAMNRTFKNAKRTSFDFLDDILIVSKGVETKKRIRVPRVGKTGQKTYLLYFQNTNFL